MRLPHPVTASRHRSTQTQLLSSSCSLKKGNDSVGPVSSSGAQVPPEAPGEILCNRYCKELLTWLQNQIIWPAHSYKVVSRYCVIPLHIGQSQKTLLNRVYYCRGYKLADFMCLKYSWKLVISTWHFIMLFSLLLCVIVTFHCKLQTHESFWSRR